MLPVLRWLRPSPQPLDDAIWQHICQHTPWVARLDELRHWRLRLLTERFLHEKTITPLAGLSLDTPQCAQLAALCCLPLLEFGHHGWRGWSQLIVYPDAFRVQRSHTDAFGVQHEGQDDLAGESWQAGPLILSWADIQADLADPQAGCVAVHEMAHKLDALDGHMDGTPPLPRRWQHAWLQDFQQAYTQLCQRVDADQPTLIDPYAAQSPDEFFAVVTEYHFSAPHLLRQTMPNVAAHLRRLYGPPPEW